MAEVIDSTGEVTVVTGGASEIGLAVGRQFVKRGHSVVLVDRDEVALEHAEQELESIGGQVMTFVGDVADSGVMAALSDEVTRSFGTPEVVCATTEAVGPVSELWELSSGVWDQAFRSNVGSVHSLIRTFVPPDARGSRSSTLRSYWFRCGIRADALRKHLSRDDACSVGYHPRSDPRVGAGRRQRPGPSCLCQSCQTISTAGVEFVPSRL